MSSPIMLAFVATVLAIGVLRPVAGLVGWRAPQGRNAARGFVPPVVGGLALWCALAVVWLFPGAGIDLPPEFLGLFALRLLVPAIGGQFWGVWLVAAADALVCAAIVQQIEGELAGLHAWLEVLAGVALMHGVHRLRGLDGIAAVVMGIAQAALAAVTTGAAHVLAMTGAAAVVALLLFNFPSHLNRGWRVQLGQGGGGHVALVFLVAGRWAMDAPGAGAIQPVELLWLLPLPTCEVLRLLMGQPQPAHRRLLDSGFSVVALFLLYALMSLLPALVLMLIRPPQDVLLPVFGGLVLLWFGVLHYAPRLMWRLPWQLRRIDVPRG